MNKIATALVALGLMSGCQTVPASGELTWIRADGHPLSDDPTYYQTRFEIDRVVCVNQMRKSTGSSESDAQRLAGTIDPRSYRDPHGSAVLSLMTQCMAGKGYMLVTKSSSEAASAALRKQRAKP